MRHTRSHGIARLWVTFCGILLLLCPLSPKAQGGELWLMGNVTDGKKKPLPEVTVKAIQLDQQVQMQVLTDAAGSFVFKNLSPGKYRLQAERANFETAIREVVLEKNITQINLVMKPSRSRASVQPPAASAQGTGSTTGNQRTARNRGFQSLRLQTPEGMDASQEGGNGTAPSLQPGSAPAAPGNATDNREGDTLLIQGSVNPGLQTTPFGGEMTEERMQEARERLRDQFGGGGFGGRGGGAGGFPRGGGFSGGPGGGG